MSVEFYTDKFNFKGQSGYHGLGGIRGEGGPAGPAGRGIGEGTFAPIVLIQAAEPSEPVANLMWIENTETVDVGEVMIGVDNTLPATKPDGTALSSGDVYIMNGNRNNHPVVWGNVTVFPLRVWLYGGSSWASATAQVYVNSQWYPTACEWIIENGKLVGSFGYGSFATLTERDGYLEISIILGSSTISHCTMKLGHRASMSPNSTPMQFVLEGEVESAGVIYLGLTTSTVPGTQATSLTNFSGYQYTGTSQATFTNISTAMISSGSAGTGVFSVRASNSRAQVQKIKNLYIVYGGDIPA